METLRELESGESVLGIREPFNALVERVRADTTGPDSAVVPGLGLARRRSAHASPVFLAKITGNASLSTNRWKYSWEEVELDGDSQWKPDGRRTGSTTERYALNLIEIGNGALGVRGNGVNQSGAAYPSGFALKPAGTGSFPLVVVMHEVVDKQGAMRYVFQYENADDGTCS